MLFSQQIQKTENLTNVLLGTVSGEYEGLSTVDQYFHIHALIQSSRVLPTQQGIITVCIYLNLRGGECWAEWQHLWGPSWWINQISNSHNYESCLFPTVLSNSAQVANLNLEVCSANTGFWIRGRVVTAIGGQHIHCLVLLVKGTGEVECWQNTCTLCSHGN